MGDIKEPIFPPLHSCIFLSVKLLQSIWKEEAKQPLLQCPRNNVGSDIMYFFGRAVHMLCDISWGMTAQYSIFVSFSPGLF